MRAANSHSVSAKTIPASSVLPVFAVVLLVMLGVAAVDVFLVRMARIERTESSRLLFSRAQELRAKAQHKEALELFRAAYNQVPTNVEYHLEFVNALQNAGRHREARASLENLLDREPANGPANIEMARILARSGEWREAAWYYHRGLYGQWPAYTSPDLTAIRLELANLLADHEARAELMAELVLLNDELERRPEIANRYGQLLLTAENWSEAERAYRSFLRTSPREPHLWAGLARAQFGAGSYRASLQSWRRAATLQPQSELFATEMKTVSDILALDPTLLRLSAAEKHRRTHHLAVTLIEALEACAPENVQLQSAKVTVEGHKRVRDSSAAADTDVDVVESLWIAREQVCPSGIQLSEAMRLTIGNVLR